GTTERQNSPVKIMDGVASFSFSLNWQGSTAGTGGTAYAVKTDGTLWGWGHNVYCQLGICDTENRLSPVKIMDGVISVDANHGHASAVKSDGTLWTWGRILGASHSIYDYNPYPIKIADNVKSIVCNPWADYFIKNDNSLWYRGGGISSDPVLYTADPLKFMDNVAYVYPQSAHAFAITLDNALWIWGTDITWKFGINAGDAAKYPVTPIKFTDGVKLPTAATQTTTPPPISTLTAKPTSSTVLVNGENIAFDAYNINGNNYFKLRDLAYILSGTGKQFEVSWDGVNNAIVLTSGKPYTTVGGEMTGKGAGDKTPTPTNSKIIMDGKEIQFTAYNIEGNNYFKLRDIGAAFDFGVDWDVANNTIVIDTSKDYTPEE
ncbi:MAG: stalk domain-containing protein, partial [Clostridiales bacterium]|nr:stalk domain-containing protein [Clostridiales bacterium]